jgi:hypothetical protein
MGASFVYKFFLGNISIRKESVVAPGQRKINRPGIWLLEPTGTSSVNSRHSLAVRKAIFSDGERGVGGYPGSHMERNEGFPTMRAPKVNRMLYFILAHVHFIASHRGEILSLLKNKFCNLCPACGRRI